RLLAVESRYRSEPYRATSKRALPSFGRSLIPLKWFQSFCLDEVRKAMLLMGQTNNHLATCLIRPAQGDRDFPWLVDADKNAGRSDETWRASDPETSGELGVIIDCSLAPSLAHTLNHRVSTCERQPRPC